MHILGSLRVGCFDEAEHLAGRFVIPIAEVRHFVLALDLQVSRMSTSHRFAGEARDVVMGIEIKRHGESPYGLGGAW